MTVRERLTRRLKFNRRASNVFGGLITGFSFAMVIPLVLILGFIFYKGVGNLHWTLLFKDQRGNGLLNAIVGGGLMVGIATVISVPIAVLTGIYLSETRRSKVAEALRITVDVFQGIPSVVLGIVAYLWLVVPLHSFSALSGAVALAIMMIPIIIKTTEESLALVPAAIKQGAYALGASYPKVMLQIVLPAGASGVVSGILLAVARVLGESAPLLFTAFGAPDLTFNVLRPMEALPPLIYKYAESPRDDWVSTAWAASFLLVVIVLGLNLLTKLVLKVWKR